MVVMLIFDANGMAAMYALLHTKFTNDDNSCTWLCVVCVCVSLCLDTKRWMLLAGCGWNGIKKFSEFRYECDIPNTQMERNDRENAEHFMFA